jgi:K+-sensing histidine kinase KdpD
LLNQKYDQLTEAEKRSFLRNGRSEVKFTQRLVEDLLFLARVDDPSCRKQDEEIDLSALVQSEIEIKRSTTSLEIRSDLPDHLYSVADPQLIRRLLRNAMENSISYASNNIVVWVEAEDGIAKIHVEDDGPGFSQSAKVSFGQKRPVRLQHSDYGKRISMGLGSVIMLAIARLYGGTIFPSNLTDGDKVVGGSVTIALNIRAHESRSANVA